MLLPRPEQQMSPPEWRRRWQPQVQVQVQVQGRVLGSEWLPPQGRGPLQVPGLARLLPGLVPVSALPERGRVVGLRRWPVPGLLRPQGARPCQWRLPRTARGSMPAWA